MGIGNDLIGDLELLLAGQVLRKRSLFRMSGGASQAWRAEKDVEQMYFGSRCLLLPSASVGLSLLLEALDLEPGREVLIAPFGWVSNWSCISRAGLVTRFLPLDDSLQLRAQDVAKRINDRTAAVVVTHLMGRGQQAVGEIAELCRDRAIPLLEDIAQSFGVSVGGRRVGTFGLAAWCSLNHHKILSTGDGGFVLVRADSLFERVSALHDQGNVMDHGKRTRPALAGGGLSLRVNDLTAAVLRAQLARYPLVRSRILTLNRALEGELRQRGCEILEPNPGDIPVNVTFRRPSHMSYPTLADSGWHVAANVPWLAEEFGRAVEDDPALAATDRWLATYSAVGSGFVDKYFAMPLGVPITAPPAGAREVADSVEAWQ